MHELIKLHGALHPLAEAIPLRAGNLSMIYEAGFLRYVRYGNIEILRMINHYVRDKNWATMPMEILSEQVERNGRSFSINYTAQCVQGDIDFFWTCRIIGREDASVIFDIFGEARTAFKRNRIGFTILHPTGSLAGKPCIVTHGDDDTQQHYFPVLISPHQPFVDIKAMRWSPADDFEAVLNFEGDLFELEDQRNWLDASHKTYCTPLTKPLPHQVKKGDKVHQTIHFKMYGDMPGQSHSEGQSLSFNVDTGSITRLPKIGIPLSTLAHDQHTVDLIRQLDPDFIRVVINHAMTSIGRRMEEGLVFGLPLEVVLFIDKRADMKFLDEIRPYKDKIQHIIVLPETETSSDEALLAAVVPLLRTYFPSAKIGSGTDAFFTELNRYRTPASTLDFLTFSINPECHAFDIRTMTENLAAHQDVVGSCKAFSEGKDVHVGPVTFRMRWNPSATTREQIKRDGIPENVDPRQVSLFGAGWTMGSIKYLAESDVAGVSYYETCGWLGLTTHPDEPWPASFGIPEGSVYPLYIVLRELLRRRHEDVARLLSSDPLKVDGISFLKGETITIILANYTSRPLTIALPVELQSISVSAIDAQNVESLMAGPSKALPQHSHHDQKLTLSPFGIYFLSGSFQRK